MKPMLESAVLPVLDAFEDRDHIQRARLQCFGVSEARVAELLCDLMARDRNPLVGTTASGGVIGVRVLSKGKSESEAEAFAEADVREIRRRLGAAVFGEGDDSLELAVARLLTGQAKSLATAESCTGGLLAKRLTDVPGSSTYFLRGYVAYANDAKVSLLNVPEELIAEKGAVSEEVAAAMASGCRTAAQSDFALSVTGIAGPAGGSPPEKPVGLVYIGLAGADRTEVKRWLAGEHLVRAEIRDRICKMALNLLRLRLIQAAEE
jgi:nicotinamide-nucleotide amidase